MIAIKHDGVWYKVGDEVPESNSNSVPSDFMNPPETPYTKTEINRMSSYHLKTFPHSRYILYF